MDALGDPEAILAAAGARVERFTPKLVQPQRGRLIAGTRVLTLADCATAPPRDYIVKGLIAPGDLLVMHGDPGCGKSVLAPYLAHGIAAGRMVFGRRVRAGAVVYLAAEDAAGMERRAAALRSAYGDTPHMLVAGGALDLQGDGADDPPDFTRLRELANAIQPRLIVLDTLAAAFPGLDENDAREMGRATRRLRDLAAGTDAAVIAVHHGAKNNGATPRGHGSLNGAADVTLRLEVAAEGLRTVRFGKNRNGSAVAGFAFTIRAEPLGTDDDGDEMTEPLAVEAEPGETGNKLPEQATRALRYLADLVARSGNTLPGGSMFPTSPLRGVPWEDWREECAARSLTTSSEKRAVNQAFQRASAALLAASYIATAEHRGVKLVWLAKAAGT